MSSTKSAKWGHPAKETFQKDPCLGPAFVAQLWQITAPGKLQVCCCSFFWNYQQRSTREAERNSGSKAPEKQQNWCCCSSKALFSLERKAAKKQDHSTRNDSGKSAALTSHVSLFAKQREGGGAALLSSRSSCNSGNVEQEVLPKRFFLFFIWTPAKWKNQVDGKRFLGGGALNSCSTTLSTYRITG